MNDVHLRAVRTVCMDGTFQVRPRQPPDIEQLFTIQIVFNDVAIPIVHALLIDRQAESYCRVLQYFRNDLQLNLNYDQLQIITDFEQDLNMNKTLTQIKLMALPHLPANEIRFDRGLLSIQLGFHVVHELVRDYNLGEELHGLMQYFQRYWMDVVGPLRFTVYRLQYKTNNFIESYHASLLRLMGQHPSLYQFYEHLRTVEERSRNDLASAVNGQQVRRRTYRMYPRNNAIISNGWANVENGTYNLQDFLRNVSYTSEQILRNEIGEPDFQPMLVIQGLNAIPPGQLPQRPPQLLLRPMPVPPLIRPAVQPPIAEVVPVAIQPAEAVQLPMVEVPAIAVQNVRNQRGVRRRGNRGNRVQGNGRGRLNARVGWAELFANIEDELEPVILEVCIICYEEVVTVTCAMSPHILQYLHYTFDTGWV